MQPSYAEPFAKPTPALYRTNREGLTPEDAAYRFLSRGFSYRTRIESRMTQLRSLREQATGIGLEMDGMPKNSRTQHGLERVVARIVDIQAELTDEIMDYLNGLEEIRAVISRVEDPECRTVLEYRYLSFMTWDRIAQELPFSRRTLLTYHRRALSEVAKLLSAQRDGSFVLGR